MEQEEYYSKPSIVSIIWSWIWSFIVAFIIVGAVYIFLGRPFTVSGASMYPTLHNGDRMICLL